MMEGIKRNINQNMYEQRKHDRTQAMMLKKISHCGHMLNDIKLYLDTHPNCKKALAAYEKYQNMFDLVTYDYNLKYSPLTASLSANKETQSWHWIEEPWPWENEANEWGGI